MDVRTGAMASLLPKLAELLLNEKYQLKGNVRDDVEYLSKEMERTQHVLGKLAVVPWKLLDQRVKHWAEEIRKLSDNMEVVVDEFLRSPNSEGIKGLMEKTGSLLKKGKTRHQIFTSEIKDITARVKDLADQFGIDPRLMALYASANDLVGIDGKKDQELIKLLSVRNNLSNKKLKVVCVVGFEGLGKTTLVNRVYDKIKTGFDCKAFVVAGQNPNLKKFLFDIISKIDSSVYEMESRLNTIYEPQLIKKLREMLENKR